MLALRSAPIPRASAPTPASFPFPVCLSRVGVQGRPTEQDADPGPSCCRRCRPGRAVGAAVLPPGFARRARRPALFRHPRGAAASLLARSCPGHASTHPWGLPGCFPSSAGACAVSTRPLGRFRCEPGSAFRAE